MSLDTQSSWSGASARAASLKEPSCTYIQMLAEQLSLLILKVATSPDPDTLSILLQSEVQSDDVDTKLTVLEPLKQLLLRTVTTFCSTARSEGWYQQKCTNFEYGLYPLQTELQIAHSLWMVMRSLHTCIQTVYPHLGPVPRIRCRGHQEARLQCRSCRALAVAATVRAGGRATSGASLARPPRVCTADAEGQYYEACGW